MCAQVYRNFTETYNSIVNPQPQAQPGTTYGLSASPSPAAGFQSTPAPPAAPVSQGGQSNRRTPPLTANLRPIYEKLFSPMERGQEAQQTALSGAVSGFSQAAGPRRSYEGIGGEGILEKAIRGTEAELPDYTTQAKGLLGAKYTGPEMLDQDTTERIGRALGTFNTQLGSTAGIKDLVRQGVPGLTRGQLGLETQVLSQDPWFRSRRLGEMGDISQAFGRLGTAQREAKTYAEGRATEEKDIAEKSKGYLTGEREEISGDLISKIDAANADQAEAKRLYDRFQESGNMAQLAQLGQATGQPDVAEQFYTQHGREGNLAKGEFEALKRKYADIQDVPLMQLAATSHGRQTLRFPDEWYAANAAKYTPAQMAQIKEKSRQRQLELEKLFGTQTALQKYFPVEYGGANTMQELAAQELGKTDARPYVALEPGMQADRGNVSTPEQRQTFNRIESLLDEADRIIESSPMRAASVEADLDGFIAEEESKIQHRVGQVQGNERAWLDYLHDARARFRQKRRSHNLRNLYDAVSMGAIRGTIEPILGPTAGKPDPVEERQLQAIQ